MELRETLLLKRKDVARLLDIDECMIAVEQAFKSHAEGKTLPPKVLGMHSKNGGFHIKAGLSGNENGYFVAKVNANFPGNSKHGLPTIQGVIVVFDGETGRLLAVADSIEITIIRTGAATGVAAKYLAKESVKTITICGCGNQGRISLKAIAKCRQPSKVFAFDTNKEQANNLARELADELKMSVIVVDDFIEAVSQSDICVTCTTSTQPFLKKEYIRPGTFIAAVGSDNEHKQELYPELTASAKLVTDITAQCATIGELHHALEAKLITCNDVYAEIGEVIAGRKPGRQSDKEIFIFDSTGTALQDVAAASIVYERALKTGIGIRVNFDESKNNLESVTGRNQRAKEALSGFFPFR